MDGSFYCTRPNTDDPCASTTVPTDLCTGYPSSPTKTCPNNYFLEHYGNLNFDPTSFGYKVLGVAYGGSLELFGAKGVAPANRVDPTSPEGACPVPPLDAQNDPAALYALGLVLAQRKDL